MRSRQIFTSMMSQSFRQDGFGRTVWEMLIPFSSTLWCPHNVIQQDADPVEDSATTPFASWTHARQALTHGLCSSHDGLCCSRPKATGPKGSGLKPGSHTPRWKHSVLSSCPPPIFYQRWKAPAPVVGDILKYSIGPANLLPCPLTTVPLCRRPTRFPDRSYSISH